MFIDTHCHVYSEYYDNIDSVISDAKEKEVNYIISSSVDKNTSSELLNLCQKYHTMYITLGIHPENINYTLEDLAFIENNLSNSKVVAIGEIGLDYHYENYDKAAQLSLFERQLSLAQRYKLPVVIHSRDATLDTINTLKKYKVKGVIHSFSGSYETALEYIKMGFKLGVNGVVTFKNSHIKEVIKKVGIKNFILETDSPYLTPEPLRGKKNSPANIEHIVNFLTNYLDISKEELANITNKNVLEIFTKLKQH